MRITDVMQVRELLELEDPRAADLVERVADTGALIRGHFRLQSGAHAPCFLRVGQLAFRRENANAIAKAWVDCGFAHSSPRLVILAAETSARFLAEALCDRLDARLALASVDLRRRPEPALKHGSLAGADRVIVVSDVVSTGASLKPLIDLAHANTEDVSVVAVAAQREAPVETIEARLAARCSVLARARWQTPRDTDCPLCHSRIQLLPAFEFN